MAKTGHPETPGRSATIQRLRILDRNGLDPSEIAELLGISLRHTYRLLERYARAATGQQVREELAHLQRQGLSYRQIATKTGYSKSRVQQILALPEDQAS